MTIEEKLQHFYDTSVAEAQTEAENTLEAHKKSLEEMFKKHKESRKMDAEAQINEVYCRANASLVKYSKAGKFRVISDEEIPRFHPDFSARKVAQAMEIEEVLA